MPLHSPVCLFLCLVFLFDTSSGLDQISLNGEWTLNDRQGKYVNLQANVPGGIYSDLMSNKVIPDVFYGFNDVETRWVSKLPWIYSKNFKVASNFLKNRNIVLTFKGIDTFAKVFINDQLVGQCENMFVEYDFDISESVKVGDNNIRVEFESPVTASERLFEEQSKNYTVVPKCVPDLYNGECHVNHIRKMQASFAWDWGPAFPSVGIWKQVFITAYKVSAIKDVSVFTNSIGSFYEFDFKVYMFGNKDQILKGEIRINVETESNFLEKIFKITNAITEKDEDNFVVLAKFIKIHKKQFNLWWPNGYGKQPLYRVVIKYLDDKQKIINEKQLKIGLRTIEVVQDPIGSKGLSFYFKVNNIPIFAKGSNMIPSHILPEYSNDEGRIRFLLESAKEVHMNMLRIWGGGMYESDMLYELADEMGILIWQDFMFACSMYPTNKEFLRTVKDEVRHQVRRLQYHPSVVLWAGNNENEAALRSNWYGTSGPNELIYMADYRKLYAETILQTVEKYDPSRKYLVSSPTNGLKSEQEGYIARNPQDNSYGDIHYYNYILDGWNSNIFPIARFSSEYGYQSLPSVLSILTATKNMSDLTTNSDFLKHRQHHPLGYVSMHMMISFQLTLPSKTHSLSYTKAFIYYSQIYQAMAVKVETEHNRRWRSYLNDADQGGTMGALYWQLNDVWIAPTWSGIDFTGKWKMMHYYAKDFFAPVILTSQKSVLSDEISIFAVSDLLAPILKATFVVNVYNWDKTGIVYQNKYENDLDLLTESKLILQTKMTTLFKSIPECNKKFYLSNCFIQVQLMGKGLRDVPIHTIFPVALRKANVKTATVKIESVVKLNSKKYSIEVSTDKPALFVWLECLLKGKFSENGFHMVESRKKITLNLEGVFEGNLNETLLITHLMDPQYFN